MKSSVILGVSGMLVAVLILPCSTGCKPPEAQPPKTTAKDKHDHGHDHDDDKHHHPTTYAAAVAEIAELRDTIRDAAAAGKLKDADAQLHEAGHILEDFPKLIDAAQLSDADKESLKKVADGLFNDFGKVDEKLHSGKEDVYSEYAAKIDAAIETLRSKLPTTDKADTDKTETDKAKTDKTETPAAK